ncbi:MAG TPA: VCBS repeat-containing protein [Rhizomicrobium sp.]|nr:VCBS repeat-containing protein [Rhizomicrobium sp.]
METVSQGQRLFTARLVIGLGQGLALYLLYSAFDAKLWPATRGLLFAPLALIWLFIPTLLISALGEMPWRKALAWAGIALVAIAVLAVFDNWSAWPQDWRYGSTTPQPHVLPSPQLFVFGAAGLFIAHALVVGAHLDHRLRANYPTHFDVAWKMAVQLVLGGAFVGAFWLLLWLGAGLFALIKLEFFSRLIQHQWFAIPVTAMAAAGALHLTDIRPALVRGARTLALTLLSWLLPLITLIVAGFLLSLPFTGLTPLWGFGHASALLLVAAAALIILINAAYQDGEAERQPPKILRLSGSLAAVLPLPLSLIAAYALHLRVAQYGWTVERIWLAASVLLAVGYAAGYVAAAIRREPWLSRIERWNFVMSLAALAILVALFTPIASPARIAVADQMARLNSGKVAAAKFDFNYLRWEGGRYGREALTVLAASQDAYIKKAANNALQQTNKYAALPATAPSFVGRLTVYPPGRALPDSFVHMDWSKERRVWVRPNCPNAGACDAIVADLDGDGRPEIVILGNAPTFAQVFREGADGSWSQAGSFQIPYQCPAVLEALREGKFQTRPPALRWNEIQIGGVTLHVREMDDLMAPPACPK